MDEALKIGEVARRTGLTVRTLHHYDAVGLLRPARRTPAGHRLYGPDELRRLQAIVSLRQLGLSLEEIGGRIGGATDPLRGILEEHVARTRARIEGENRLVVRLEGILASLRDGDAPSLDDLVQAVEVTMMFERYYTPEQLERLRGRRESLGDRELKDVERHWAALTERVRTAMEDGVEPSSEGGRALGRDWRTLTAETVAGFTGGDPGLRSSLDRLWTEEPDVGARWGMDPALVAWARRAVEAAEAGEPRR